MGEYEYLWNERKDFLLSSTKIGAIATVCVTILTIIALLYNGMDFGSTVLTILTGGWIGLVVGLFLCIVFVWVFGAVVIGYAIYLPISSIYLYVMYKNEIKLGGRHNEN